MKISVCMATYNGSLYLHKQIKSILEQLSGSDELIIVDDCSSDESVKIILSLKDPRISTLILNNKNIGVNKSFEIAILKASNEVILLADQDDIWVDGRIELMKTCFEVPGVSLAVGNSNYIDAEDNAISMPILSLKKEDSKKTLKNIINILIGKSSYFGCTMAFKKEILKYIMPFPSYIESHDLWIAMACIMNKSIVHVEDIVLLRRLHGKNTSLAKRPIIKKLWSRVILVLSLIHLASRLIVHKLYRAR